MAQYQNQYDEVGQTEESGNPVSQRGEYGNAINHHTGTTDGEYGRGTADYATATTEVGKYGGAPGSGGTDTGEEYGNPVGQRDEYGDPTGHHTSITDSEYGIGTVDDKTATTGAGKYGGALGSAGTDIGEEYGNPVGQRDEDGNPIGRHTSTTDGEYGGDTVDYATTKTGAGKYDGAPGSAGTDIGGEYGNAVGQRDEDGNPIGHHTSTTDGEYGSGTVGYATATTRAGKYGDAPSTGLEDDPSHATSTTPGDYYSAEQPEGKKGIID